MKFNYWEKRRKQVAKMNDDERFIDIFQVVIRVIDDTQRVVLDYGFSSISRKKFEEQLKFCQTMFKLAIHSVDLYLDEKNKKC